MGKFYFYRSNLCIQVRPWLFRAQGALTPCLHMILVSPVMCSVLTVVYFAISEYRIQYIEANRVIHLGIFNLYIRLFKGITIP